LTEANQIELTRELLYDRHRLSHRQIDDWLGRLNEPGAQIEVFRQLQLVAFFLKITDRFRELGIEFISFKGPLLSQKIYGDPTYRFFKDFDLLIEPDQISHAVEVLRDEGFEISNLDVDTSECKRQLLEDHNHHVECYHPTEQIVIEVHSRLFPFGILPVHKWDKLIQANTETKIFQDRKFTVFSHEFEMIYLITHAGTHFWNRLKWLLDIRELMNRYPLDERHFLELTVQINSAKHVAVCNALLAIYFPDTTLLPSTVKVSEKSLKYVLRNIESEDIIDGKNWKEFFPFYANRLALFSNTNYKLSVLKSVLFSPELALKKWMPCSAILNYIVGPFWKLTRWNLFNKDNSS
jgi:hypothetical protein